MYSGILSDPKNHDSRNYVYLVTSVLDSHGVPIMTVKERFVRRAHQMKNPDGYYRASLIGELSRERAREMFNWNHAIEQTDTYQTLGFIIKIPSDEVVQYAWNADLRSPPGYDEFKGFCLKHKGKVKPPVELLTNTSGITNFKDCNELGVRGHPDTRIAAAYYKDIMVPETELQSLSAVVTDITGGNIPVISIPEPSREYSCFDEAIREFFGTSK